MTDTFEPVAAPKPVEVELKYRVVVRGRRGALPDGAAGRRVRRARPGAGLPASRTATSTPTMARWPPPAMRSGCARRSRARPCRSSRSEHSEGPAAPFGARRSKDRPIPSAGPSDWPTSAARSLVLEHAGTAPLVELVTVRQVRRKRQIRDAGTRVELSLDEVSVIAGGREIGRFAELEAELRRGPEVRLEELAAIFDADLTLTRTTESKLDGALAIAAAHGASGNGTASDGAEAGGQGAADSAATSETVGAGAASASDDADKAGEASFLPPPSSLAHPGHRLAIDVADGDRRQCDDQGQAPSAPSSTR